MKSKVKILLCAVLLAGFGAPGQSDASRVLFHVTKISSSDVSDEHSSGTEYTVEGYDVDSQTMYRGKCRDTYYYDNDGKVSLHVICLVPKAGGEYGIKVWPTSFMFPCDTPDGTCPGGDPNVNHYMYAAYTITDEEEKPKHK
jgi:hypothetical protein